MFLTVLISSILGFSISACEFVEDESIQATAVMSLM